MKKYCLLAICFCFASLSFAQFRYLAAKSLNTTGTYTDLGASGTVITTANFNDANSSVQNIGFNFFFNGIVFTQFILNSNGFIKLGSAAPATNNYDVLSSGESNTIAPFNYNLQGGTSTSEYRMLTSGVPGSRACTIQFENLREVGTPQYNNINFQVKLYETTNVIEFVYGTFTTSGVAAAFKEMIVGIQGTDSTHSVNVTKSSADLWSAASFINGVYPAPQTKFNNRNNVLPTSGTIFRFTPVNDARVDAVYTLSQLPIPLGNPHVIRANVANNGGTTLTNLSVTVTVTGANSFTNTQQVTIQPFANAVVTFANFSPANTGNSVITVTTPADDSSSNNSNSFNQTVNMNTYSYPDASPVNYGFGWGTDAGLLLAKFKITGSDTVGTVRIGLGAVGTGNSIYAVVINAAGTIVAQSTPYITTGTEDWTTRDFAINNSPVLTNTDFYVGLAQTANPTQGYFPLGVQNETPGRPGAFYFLFGLTGGAPSETISSGRFMITAIMKGKKDASVEAVYTLTKAPRPFGTYQHVVSAKIKNKGTANLINYPVVLNITGANTATDSEFIYNLAPLDSLIVDFDQVNLMTAGTNTVTVSVPPDIVNSNNSATVTQVINDTLYSYADATPAVGRAGFNTSEGIVLTRYSLRGGEAFVTGVRVYISNDPNNIGQLVSGVAWNSDTDSLKFSDSSAILVSDTAKYKTFKFANPLRFSKYEDVYVGLKQKINVLGFNPVGYQAEVAGRGNTFFKDAPPYGSLNDFTSGRLMIDAIVKPASGSLPDYGDELLADWNFTDINSPASAPARRLHRNLISSNLVTRGTGAPASPANNSFASTGFQNNGISTSNTDYFQFEIGANLTDTLSLSSFDCGEFVPDSSFFYPNGVDVQLAYSLNGTTYTLIGSPVHLTYFSEFAYVDLSGVTALQNILNGTKVRFRIYATGNGTTGAFGFTPRFDDESDIAIYGTIRRNAIIVDPVIPVGADFYLPNCSSTANGSISFTSTGTYAPGNVYVAKINTSNWGRDTAAAVIGTLASTANAGTINITIPAGINKYLWGNHEGYIQIWVESTSNPWAISVPGPEFKLTMGEQCYGPYSDFRSKQSGNWNNLSTWEMSKDSVWVASTFIPDQQASNVQISAGDSVAVTAGVNLRNITISGKLAVLNGAANHGSITFYLKEIGGFLHDGYQYCMQIDSGAVLQVASATAPFDSVIRISSNYVRPARQLIKNFGTISIGDGSSANGAGFDRFATNIFKRYKFYDQSIFEWNTTSLNGLNSNAEFFRLSYHPLLKLTHMPPTNFGGTEPTIFNATVEINTPVTMGGAGAKEFRDGLSGVSVLNQASGSGEFRTINGYTVLPETDTSGGTIGILSGHLTVNLSNGGLTLRNGIRVIEDADVLIMGSGISRGRLQVESTAKMTLDALSIFTIENADLINDGIIDGAGKIQFTGPDTSHLKSSGDINAKLELSGKQLRLNGNANVNSIDLLGGSHLRLDSFQLNMRSGNLVGDANNFIVTNDTGSVSRFIASSPTTEVLFNVGINESSYSPVGITNSGIADDFRVRVGQGVRDFNNNPITTGNVDRTWYVTDAVKGGSIAKLRMQWNATEEQSPGFNRNQSYVSRLSVCPLPRNCSGAFYDMGTTGAAADEGASNYSRFRTSVDSFTTNSFIVTSTPFVFTFMKNGNWSDSLNWTPGIPAPYIITAGMEVIINPDGLGECVSDSDIQIVPPGRLTVMPGKKLKIAHP